MNFLPIFLKKLFSLILHTPLSGVCITEFNLQTNVWKPMGRFHLLDSAGH